MGQKRKRDTVHFAKFSFSRVIDHIFPTRQDRGKPLEPLEMLGHICYNGFT